MIQFDEHIFQMGWFNHQLVNIEPENDGLETDFPFQLSVLSGSMLIFQSFFEGFREVHTSEGSFNGTHFEGETIFMQIRLVIFEGFRDFPYT